MSKRFGFIGAPGVGKAQPLHSKILTPSGWTTFADIRVGAQVCTPDGEIALVREVHDRGVRTVYRVTLSDGRSMECCDEHLFKVYYKAWNRQWHIMSCSEIKKKIDNTDAVLSLPLNIKNQIISIKSIEYISVQPVKCISIDHPDRLYITDGYIVTHNSTLTADVYKTLKQSGINVEMVPEFIRYEIQRNGTPQSIWEQYRTLQNQRELEDAVPKTFNFVIVDCTTVLSYFYAVLYADHQNPRDRLVMQDMYKEMTNDIYLKRYTGLFYLPTPPKTAKIKFDDGVRTQTQDQVTLLDQHMAITFKMHNPGNIHFIDGAFDTRLDKVMKIIAESD